MELHARFLSRIVCCNKSSYPINLRKTNLIVKKIVEKIENSTAVLEYFKSKFPFHHAKGREQPNQFPRHLEWPKIGLWKNAHIMKSNQTDMD